MARAFISYSRVDTAFTREFVDLLRDDMFPAPENYVWYDRSLTGGQNWWDEILSQIAQADIFIYLLSNESVQSPYCQAEFREAQRLQKLILTIQVRDNTLLSQELSEIQYVNMKDGVNKDVQGIRQLARALRYLEGKIPPNALPPKWQPPTPKPPQTPEPSARPVNTPQVMTPPLKAAVPQAHAAETRVSVLEDMRESERLTDRAVAHNEGGNYAYAIEDATVAIRLNPKNARAYNTRGYAYDEQQDLDRALADYSQAITLDSRYALAYYNRGSVYNLKRQYDLAIADFNLAIALNQYDGHAYNNRGVAYYAKQANEQAIKDYSKAIELEPMSVRYQNRAKAYRALGRVVEAEADERKAKDLEK